MTHSATPDLSFGTLISASELVSRLKEPDLVVFDCRFSLNDPGAGETLFLEGHIPGAFYAHLDDDLSSPVVPGVTGRHPLPDPSLFARFLMDRGVGRSTQVVCYDDKGGAIASRMWWVCKWIGNEKVAVLDGGIQAWVANDGPLERMIPELPASPGTLEVEIRDHMVADASAVMNRPTGTTLLDARGPARYRGEHEPIDPVAGHIPGAISAPFDANLNDGSFLEKRALRDRFGSLSAIAAGDVICYCGSGVTAAHNALAIVRAGFPMPRLYPGSWSEWIVDEQRPIETGDGTAI